MIDDLDFFCEGMEVGYFEDVTAYPTVPGAYRYMPYRGPGHYEMAMKLRESGSAECTYPRPDGEVSFVVRKGPESYLLVLEGFSGPRR